MAFPPLPLLTAGKKDKVKCHKTWTPKEREERLRKVIRSLDNCYVKVRKSKNDEIAVNIEREDFFCDTFSLKDVIQLIALMELFFSVILIIISFEHIFPRGHELFFIENRQVVAKNLGIYLFLIQFFGCFFNITSIGCLFVAIKLNRSVYVLPHLIWQILYICLGSSTVSTIMYFMFTNQILRGAAEALLFMILIPLCCQCYFFYLFQKFYKQIKKNEKINQLLKHNVFQNLNRILANGLLEFNMERERKRFEISQEQLLEQSVQVEDESNGDQPFKFRKIFNCP